MATLITAILAVYWPVRHYSFIVLDDYPYVVDNSHITHLNWETLKWSFTTFRGANWMPLTWLSHALDYRWFSLRSGRYHDTNLLLHMLNAAVLFWVLLQATGYVGRSFMVAALFALHPMNVESVAWIAERKNLLSMLFLLLALGAYYAYARQPRARSYLLVVALFALGLLCKPQIVTLPFVLLLWDYWPLQRTSCPVGDSSSPAGVNGIEPRGFSWLVLEKVPLLTLSLGSAILTVKAQSAGGTMMSPVASLPLSIRLGNVSIAYVRYLGDAIWPTRLAFFYPYVRTAPPVWHVMAAVGLLVVITFWTIRSRNHPYLAVGWLWFLGTLVPMIGFVQVGSQSMADRYAYLPFIGLFLGACWGIGDAVTGRRGLQATAAAGAVTILLLLSFATRRQLSYWSDDFTLWAHTAAVTKNNWMAENMMGEDMLRNNDRDDAIAHFRASEAMEPLFPLTHLHVGIYEEEHGHPREALAELNRVLDLTQPVATYMPIFRSHAMTYMAFAYNQLGDYEQREKYLKMAGQLQQAEIESSPAGYGPDY